MKKLTALLLSLSMLVCLCACGDSQSTAIPSEGESQVTEGGQVSGGDWQVLGESTYIGDEEETNVVKTPLRSELWQADGVKLADITYEHDAYGNRTKVTHAWVGSGTDVYTYTYDADGNLVEETTQQNGGEIMVTTHEYQDGRITATTSGMFGTRTDYYYENGVLVYSQESYGDGSLGIKTTYTHSSSGQLLARDRYYSDGDKAMGFAFEYDDNGNLSRQTEIYSSAQCVYDYSYNSDNQLVQTICSIGDRVAYSLNNTYDNYGRLMTEGVVVDGSKYNGYYKYFYE